MNETLIIGDIHHRVHIAEAVFAKEGYDKPAVLVGDYFDDFGDTASSAAATATWLKGSLEHPERVHLIGNHDVPYRYGGQYNCPGWEEEKHIVTNSILTDEDWNKLQLTHTIGKHLFSHAGVTTRFLKAQGDLNYLTESVNSELLTARAIGCDLLNDYDGITWVRPWILEHTKWDVVQVFGHTPQHHITKRVDAETENVYWIMDALHNGEYGVLHENGEIEVRSVHKKGPQEITDLS